MVKELQHGAQPCVTAHSILVRGQGAGAEHIRDCGRAEARALPQTRGAKCWARSARAASRILGLGPGASPHAHWPKTLPPPPLLRTHARTRTPAARALQAGNWAGGRGLRTCRSDTFGSARATLPPGLIRIARTQADTASHTCYAHPAGPMGHRVGAARISPGS